MYGRLFYHNVSICFSFNRRLSLQRGIFMKGIKQYLLSKEDIQTIMTGISTGMKEQLVAGLSGSARSLLVSLSSESIKKPILLVTYQLAQAQQLYDDLVAFMGEDHVYLYPVNELIASEIAVASPELRYERIDALTNWSRKESGILIAPVAAVKRMLPPPHDWHSYQLPFRTDEVIDLEESLRMLVAMGYEHVSMVTSPGEFSRRGGIIDIYPITSKHPIRIELFDDEIDSIRYFDGETQRSLEKVQEKTIGPATELLLTEEDMVSASQRLEVALGDTLAKMKTSAEKETLIETMENDIDQLKNAERFQEMYK